MILTEEEAKTKRCQESFPAADGLSLSGHAESAIEASFSISSGGGAGARLFTKHTAPLNCIASGCMAWCWFDNRSDQAIKEPRGYCGKAGKP